MTKSEWNIVVGLRLIALLSGFFISSCSQPKGPCGQAFCLTTSEVLFNSVQNVDSNNYIVKIKNNRFLVYEGNQPDIFNKTKVRKIEGANLPRNFADGNLYRGRLEYVAVLRTQKSDWPMYISITAKSENELDGILHLIVGKMG